MADCAAFKPDTTSYPFNQPGTYTLQLWASTVDGTSVTAPLATTTLHVIKFSATFNNPTEKIFLGNTRQIAGKVSVEGSALGAVTVNAYSYDNSGLTANFTGYDFTEVYLESRAEFTIDTTKEPFNKADTYVLHVWAKDVNGVGGSRALAEMTVEVVEGSANPPKDDPKMSADYMGSVFYQKLKQVNLEGDYIKDLVAVARSQIEYCEGSLKGTGGNIEDRTEYNHFYNNKDVSWCANFVSWCAKMAEIPSDIIAPRSRVKDLCMNAAGVEIAYFYTNTDLENKMTNARIAANKKAEENNEDLEYTEKEIEEVTGSQNFLLKEEYKGKYYANRKDFCPQPGDLIFFHNSNWTYAWGHVGIVTECYGDTVYFIDGNNNGNGTPTSGETNVAGKVDERKVKYTDVSSNVLAFARPDYAGAQ